MKDNSLEIKMIFIHVPSIIQNLILKKTKKLSSFIEILKLWLLNENVLILNKYFLVKMSY